MLAVFFLYNTEVYMRILLQEQLHLQLEDVGLDPFDVLNDYLSILYI